MSLNFLLTFAVVIFLPSLVVSHSTVNRLVCRNAVSAHEHNLLSECINEWKKYPWSQFRVDNSSDCTNCRLITPFVWDYKIAPLLCSTRLNNEECKNIINTLSQLKSIKDRNNVLCNILTLCDSHTYIKDLNFGVPICDDCKRLVEDMRKVIEDNSTATVIEEQLNELVCNNLPGEIIPYCKNIINAHIPYVLHIISEKLSPGDICATLGLCINEKRRFTLADFITYKRKKCDNVNAFSWIRRPLVGGGHKWTSYKSRGVPTCPNCLSVLNQFKTGVKNPTTQKALKKLLDDKVCTNMGFFAAACRDAIEYNFGQIIDALMQVDPKDICNLFEMCTGDDIDLPNSEIAASSTSQDFPGFCQLCVLVTKKIFDLTVANRTEAAIVLALETVCEYLPSDYDSQCENIVEKYGAKIVNAILEGTAPDLLCASIGLCASPLSSTQKNQVLPSRLLINNHVETTATLSSGIDSCLTCKFFVETIYGQLQNNKTEDELKHLIRNACSILPSGYVDRCSELIDRYFDDVIKLIENEYTPEQICQMIALCQSIPMWSLSEQNPCLLGSTYWCRDYSTAKMCNAVNYCSSTGWTTYPPSNQNELFKSQCELMKLSEICVNSELAKKCNRLNECYQQQVKNFLNLFSISTMTRSDEKYKESPCLVCITMTTKWLLQWDIFGGPIINRSICDEYKTSEELQQCYHVVEKAGMLLTRSRNDRKNVEQICACTINCDPGKCGKDKQGGEVDQSVNEDSDKFGTFALQDFDKVSCLWGPTYWCSSKDTARKCNATNYCTATYWPEINTNNILDNDTENKDIVVDSYVTPSVKTKSEHLLGIKPCTWGPAYWCQSEQIAKTCGDKALLHCQSKVWIKISTSKIPHQTSSNHVKCTRGPSFWCASFENAKLCGEDAERHCINVVWSNIHKSKYSEITP
ncbi:hypothetical protein MN116_004992 [Schistosoma mekongi]|uniref:Prosaposin n=1 Tax=Schistosoma mekongi TaxID=38744 RepID=A0AAE1ZE09_SCHME|nr:hypothetical protein MN116_004992 [Schistosoma mekongi]